MPFGCVLRFSYSASIASVHVLLCRHADPFLYHLTAVEQDNRRYRVNSVFHCRLAVFRRC